MPIRPPRALAPKPVDDNPLNAALEHEILAEKAATYGRLLERLEKALQALEEFDAARIDCAHGNSARGARGPARARPDGRASMASRPAGGSSAIRHGSNTCPDIRPTGGKRERAPADQAAPAEAGPQDRTAASETETEHQFLLDAAGAALWYVMIQRDLCGFRRHDLFLKEYDISPAVRLRMGLVRSR